MRWFLAGADLNRSMADDHVGRLLVVLIFTSHVAAMF